MIQVEEIKLSRVKTNKENPRTITKDKFDKLVNSILVFPKMLQLRPIVVDGKMTALGGNMRNEALRVIAKMQPDEIAERLAGIADFVKKTKGERDALVEHWGKWLENPTALIIRADQLSEQEREQFIVKDNVSFGTWNYDALSSKWDNSLLNDWGMDVWQTAPVAFQPTISNANGYIPSEPDESEIDKEENIIQQKIEEDDFSEEEAKKTEPRVKTGEIWQLGEHRLMCGDSTDAASVALLMDGQKADMVFTDPPYGVSIGDKNKALNSVLPSGRCAENIANDNISVNDLYPILVKAMTNCRENCKDCACYYVTSPQGGELGLMMMMMKNAGLPVRHMLIWEKNSATFSLGRLDYDYQHEPIFYTWTKSHKNYRNGEFRTTIWKYDKPRKCDLHPTMKPVELVANCMMDASVEGDIVLDMFGGSGTTIIAAEQLGRKARLMELDPHYCDVIIARWEKLTGNKANKIA